MKRIKAIIGLLLLMAGQAVAQTSVPQSFRQLPSGRDAAYDINRGFIHPGGLHTQEDFDRVKAQIAANNQTVVKAWNKLTSSEYSQSGVQTYPTEIIARKYWDVAADGTVLTATSTSLDAFPFELVPVSSTGIEDVRMETMNDEKVTVRNGAGVVYDLLGRSLAPRPLAKGIYVINGKKVVINNYIQ